MKPVKELQEIAAGVRVWLGDSREDGYSLTNPTPRETFLYVNIASSLSRSFSACALVVKSRDRKTTPPLRCS